MEGVVTFTYEDAAGNAQFIEVPFTFEAMEMPVWDDPGIYEEPTVEEAIPWSLIIAAIALVVIIVAVIVIRKILKRRKEKALELEDVAFEIPQETEEPAEREDKGTEKE